MFNFFKDPLIGNPPKYTVCICGYYQIDTIKRLQPSLFEGQKKTLLILMSF